MSMCCFYYCIWIYLDPSTYLVSNCCFQRLPNATMMEFMKDHGSVEGQTKELRSCSWQELSDTCLFNLMAAPMACRSLQQEATSCCTVSLTPSLRHPLEMG